MKNKGNLIVISGPSGTGKGTVCKELLKAQPEIVFLYLQQRANLDQVK